MAPLSAAPSATVANSSSSIAHRAGEPHPHAVLGRQAKRGDRRPNCPGRFAAGLKILVVERRLDIDEAAQFRRLWRVSGNQPAPGKGRVFPLQNPLDGVGDRGDRRLDVLESRLVVTDAVNRLRNRAKDAAQARIVSEGGEKGLGVDQLGGVLPDVVDRTKQDALAGEKRAAVGAPDRADEVLAPLQRLRQGGGRFFRAFRRGRVDDRNDEVGPLREERVQPDLLASPGERARQELARVGRDRQMARDVKRCERCADDKERDDEPRVAGRETSGSDDRLGNPGAVGSRHGWGWSPSIASGQWRRSPRRA